MSIDAKDLDQFCPPDKQNPFIPNAKPDPSIRLNNLWQQSLPLKLGDPVMKYLDSRGITEIPQDIRYCQGCWEPDTNKKHPAMIAMIRDVDGAPVSLHRTYLSESGGKADIEKPKKLMTGKKSVSGCSVQLSKLFKNPFLNIVSFGIAEGIETALSCQEIYRIPVWAAISTSGMESFKPPVGIEHVCIFTDDDLNYAGAKSAYVLAHKLSVNDLFKGTVTVEFPEAKYNDYNDLLRDAGQKWKQK